MKPYLPPGRGRSMSARSSRASSTRCRRWQRVRRRLERTFGDEPVEVRGDRDELFQVFENLLENAWKVTASRAGASSS